MAKTKERKRKRVRVGRDKVRDNAKRGGSGGLNFFKLPKGIRMWYPEKKGKYTISILPYETMDVNHPDDLEVGSVWYKRPFRVHRNIGVQNKSYVCPTSIGERCPICEESDRLRSKDRDKYAKAISKLYAQKWTMYNIVDPDDEEKIALFSMSIGKFAGPLEKELEETDEENTAFFEVINGDGRMLEVRFSKENYEGSSYLEASRFDFEEREDMDEDEILEKVVDLDNCLNILPYDRLNALFKQEDDDDEPEEKPKKSKGKKKKDPEPEEEEEEEDDDDNDDDEDDDDSDNDEPEEVPKKSKSKSEDKKKDKSKKVKKGECPMGGTFGEDVDRFDECDDCPNWKACDNAAD